ncbi:MAG: hypothetical protein JO124_01965 [Hyphomicrobiales bacterium]|nr:hypothetical protein [Hyphomicrobiales bacterium]
MLAKDCDLFWKSGGLPHIDRQTRIEQRQAMSRDFRPERVEKISSS